MLKSGEIIDFKLCKKCQALADAGTDTVESGQYIVDHLCANCKENILSYNNRLSDLIPIIQTLPHEYTVTRDTKNKTLTVKIIRPVKITIILDVKK